MIQRSLVWTISAILVSATLVGCGGENNTQNTNDTQNTPQAANNADTNKADAPNGMAGGDGRLPEGHPPVDPREMQAAVDAARQQAEGGMTEAQQRMADAQQRMAGAPQRTAGEATSGGERLTWSVPDDWVEEPPAGSMRKAQYRIPGAGGGEAGELVVFFFPGGAGTLEANVNRWRSQFKTPAGEPLPDQMFQRKEMEVNGMKVTIVDMIGTYNPTSMSFGGQTPPPQENQRMIASIVETPRGGWYFKAVGPAATMADRADEFEQLVESFEVKESQ